MNILIVEDNQDTLSFLEQALREEDFSVDAVSDGQAGLSKALSSDYDAIILDNVLPGKTGPEICREMRKRGKGTRILMLSVNGDPETKAEAIGFGADDYLSKPFSIGELLARLRALLRRPEKLKEEIIKAGTLALDTINRSVSRNGLKIPLTAREFDLLEYFLRNRGKALSKMDILEHVWDMNADPFTNTVEMHVCSLRKKLGKNCPDAAILTVHGIGYKMA